MPDRDYYCIKSRGTVVVVSTNSLQLGPMPPCPTCSAPLNSVLRISRSVASAGFYSPRHSAGSPGPLIKGFASSSPFSKPSDTFPSQRHEALTLLHKITKIFPRVRDATGNSEFPRPEETPTFWDSILSDVYEDLAATTERPVKILGVFPTFVHACTSLTRLKFSMQIGRMVRPSHCTALRPFIVRRRTAQHSC